MAVGLYFTPTGFNKDKYDEAIRQLEEAGAGAPAGRTFHVALESGGRFRCSISGSPRTSSRRSGRR
jgi:hypothetical protein